MPHPTSAELELYACRDLRGWPAWRMQRHIKQCAECSEQAEQLRQFWQSVDWAKGLPERDWNRMAAEMQANIHLGLSAGQCIAPPRRAPLVPVPMAIAFASLLLVAVAGTYYHQQSSSGTEPDAPVLETSGAGIQSREGTDVMEFVNRSSRAPIQTVSAGGEVRSRYIDRESGDVTIVNVYAQ